MEPLKIIQIGLGGWGWSWIQVALDSPHWELTGIVDLNQEVLSKACENYGIDSHKAFISLKEALKHVEADAVLIVAPPQFHAPIAIEALENGLHCIIEKPLAATIQDSLKIVRTAERVNRKVMVAQNYRFKRAPQTVKQVLEKNMIGDIGTAYINFQKYPKFDGFRTEMEEPLIIDMAIHHFDQIRGILGLEPKRVTAHSWNPKWSEFKGNAIASVLFEMEDGVMVNYVGSWVSKGWETTWDGDWRIQGTEGELRWADNKVTFKSSDVFKSVFMEGALESNGEMVVDLIDLPSEERLASLAEFAQAIQQNREPETSGMDNLKSLAMVLGANLSVKMGRAVTIEEVLKMDTIKS